MPGKGGDDRGGAYRTAGTPEASTYDTAPAVEVAAKEARKFGVSARAFRRSVTEARVSEECYTRVAWRIERRGVGLRTEPAAGVKKHELSPLPDPGRIDPWAVDRGRLVAESRVAASCPTCAGEKAIACPVCDGTTRARCRACNGSGREVGQRGMRNCSTCRGRGDSRCHSCTRGKVRCDTCDGHGAVYAWLDGEARVREEVTVEPEAVARRVHADVAAPRDFDRAPQSLPARLLGDTGWCDPAGSLPPPLAPRIDARFERVVASRRQELAIAVFAIGYESVLAAGTIFVNERDGRILPTSDWRPLRWRFVAAVVTFLLGGLVAVSMTIAYLTRDVWFGHYGHAGLVAGLGWLAAALWALALPGLLLTPRARSVLSTWLPTGGATAATALVVTAWVFPRPSLARAQTAVAAGDEERALMEANAVERTGTDVRGAGAIVDDVKLRELKRTTALDHAVELAERTWAFSENAGRARDQVHALAVVQVNKHYADGSHTALADDAKVLRDFDGDLAKRASGLASLCKAHDCAHDMDCQYLVDALDAAKGESSVQKEYDATIAALKRELPAEFHSKTSAAAGAALDARVARLASAVGAASCYQKVFGKAVAPNVVEVSKQLDRAKQQQAAVARAAEARLNAQQAREKAIAAAREARENAAAAAQEREEAAANRSLVCRDGTTSGCSCYGSHRGCCSHHGGVSRCE